MEVVQPKVCSYSSWVFGCDLPVKEFPTDEEAIEYQEMIEKEEKGELVVC